MAITQTLFGDDDVARGIAARLEGKRLLAPDQYEQETEQEIVSIGAQGCLVELELDNGQRFEFQVSVIEANHA